MTLTRQVAFWWPQRTGRAVTGLHSRYVSDSTATRVSGPGEVSIPGDSVRKCWGGSESSSRGRSSSTRQQLRWMRWLQPLSTCCAMSSLQRRKGIGSWRRHINSGVPFFLGGGSIQTNLHHCAKGNQMETIQGGPNPTCHASNRI